MPRVSLDITNVEPVGSGGFANEILPPEQGPYILRVSSATNEKSKAGNAMAVFDFEVVENQGAQADEWVDLSGKSFRQWYPLMNRQPMIGRIKALANACEVPYDRSGFDLDDFLDAVFECDLVVDASDAGEFNRIDNPRLAPAAEEPAGGEPAQAPDAGADEPPAEEEAAQTAAPRRAPARGRTTRTGTAQRPPRRSVR